MGDPSKRAVRDTYETIAEHFVKTREHPWPEVTDFLADRQAGGVAIDVGCGNGRHTELLVDHADAVLGIDASRAMLSTARDRCGASHSALHFIPADATALPLAADSVALAICIATVHHLPTTEARQRVLGELSRVLGPDGIALVSAWSTAHDRFEATAEADTGFDTEMDWTLPDGEVVPRFYHIYAPGEFERDLRAAGLVIERHDISSGNSYAVVRPEGKRP
jgi:ubiquinone/menaquinone biosynthesis C-methylase UbiE